MAETTVGSSWSPVFLRALSKARFFQAGTGLEERLLGDRLDSLPSCGGVLSESEEEVDSSAPCGSLSMNSI